MPKRLTIEDVRAWREAAIADGWSLAPMYPRHEDATRAGTLTRDGFVIQAIARPAGSNIRTHRSGGADEASLAGWGPDSLAIMVAVPYSFEALVTATRVCHSCKANDVNTFRVSFAGRVCAECLPGERTRLETPGWCD